MREETARDVVPRVPMHADGSVFYSYLNMLRVRDLLFVPAYSQVDATLQAGLFAAFFCPFVGMARAKWDGPRKRPRRSSMERAVMQ